MHHYLVVHKVQEYPETQEAWLALWEGVLKNICGEARWLNSYYDPVSEELYCLWQAESEDQIKACFTPEDAKMAPIEHVREVAYFDIQALSGSSQ